MTKAEFIKILKANGFTGKKNVFQKHVTSDWVNPNRIPRSFWIYLNTKEKNFSFFNTAYKKEHLEKICYELSAPYAEIEKYCKKQG